MPVLASGSEFTLDGLGVTSHSLLLAVASASSAEPFWIGTVVAAVIAAFVALTGTVVNVVYQVRASGRQRDHEMQLERIARAFSARQQFIDWRVRQLNELYGPVQMYLATNKLLRKSLPGAEGKSWRLVHHLPEAKADPALASVVDAIIEINREIEHLLINKAGLMEEEEMPPSFSTFMNHSRLLQLAWEKGEPLGVGEGHQDVTDVPYPRAFDEDVKRSVHVVRSALNEARAAITADATPKA